MENSSQYMEQESYFKIVESINGFGQNGSESLNFEKKVYKQLLVDIEKSLKDKKEKKQLLMKEIARIIRETIFCRKKIVDRGKSFHDGLYQYFLSEKTSDLCCALFWKNYSSRFV